MIIVNPYLVLLQVHQRDGQLGEIGDVVVKKLGRLVHAAVEATVADLGDVRVVRARNELLQVCEPRSLRVGVDELGLDVGVPRLLSRHLKVPHQVLPVIRLGGRLDNVHIVGGVVGLDEGVDGLLHHVLLQLRLSQLRPHCRLIAPLRKLIGSVIRKSSLCKVHTQLDVMIRLVKPPSLRAISSKYDFSISPVEVIHVLDEDLDGRAVDLEFLEDGESLLVQLTLDRDVGDVRRVVVVQPVDVLHHLRLVRLDRRQDQQVL